MKNTLKEKFKNSVLVQPLYRKIKNNNKIKPRKLIFDSKFELDGHDISVKRDFVNNTSNVKTFNNDKTEIVFLRNAYENSQGHSFKDKRIGKHDRGSQTRPLRRKMLERENIKADSEVASEDKTNELIQADSTSVLDKAPRTWLRLYPLPQLPEESAISVIFRCIVCQLGLATLLVLWTFMWIFVIHSFEGPNEIQVSQDFEKAQNQLVIDLATELRQITPLSPRWKAAIEQRIEEAREITANAVVRGARHRLGQYWDLSGNFLFTIYVMTALGFGAPVPQTIGGRIAALVYAILAVPIHIYLTNCGRRASDPLDVLNVSKCIVFHVSAYMGDLRHKLRKNKPIVEWKISIGNENKREPNCTRHSEVLKAPQKPGIGRKIMQIISVIRACHGLPLLGILYYVIGACIFGIPRNLKTLDTLMFPLDFTTSGQLEFIPGHVRILYGLYIEGAIMIVACALAVMRHTSGNRITRFMEKHKLFVTAE